MKRIKLFISLLIVSSFLGLISCGGGGGGGSSGKTFTEQERMEHLAARIYYTLHNVDGAISEGVFGAYYDENDNLIDSGNEWKIVDGFKSGKTYAVGYKTKKKVPTGTYTSKTVYDSEFLLHFQDYAYDNDLVLKSDTDKWSWYKYHEEDENYMTGMPKNTEYELSKCEYTLNLNSKTYTGKINYMHYKTYDKDYWDNDYYATGSGKYVYSRDRFFDAYIEMADGIIYNIDGSNW